MDRNQADLTFLRLSMAGCANARPAVRAVSCRAGAAQPGETVALIHKIAENMRRRPRCHGPTRVSAYATSRRSGRPRRISRTSWMAMAAAEPETVTIVERLAEMATAVANGPDPATPAGLVRS